MTTAYQSDAERAIRGFKAELRAREGAQINIMARHYLTVEKALEANIAALSEQLARLAAEGLEPSWSQLYRLERWQALQLQLMEELARFNGWAAELITQEQLRMMVDGIDNAAAVLDSMKPGLGQFTKMPHDALRGMVGIARDGSPLGDLLAKSYPAIRDAMTRELMRSVALGRNPRVTAQLVRRATGMGLNRALVIARTEQMRVYREATLDSYKAAGVWRYQIVAAFDDRVCPGCLATDGDIIDSAVGFDAHPQCRCDALPYFDVAGIENPMRESSESWFGRQPDSTQVAIMGPGRLAAYKSGQAQWSDLATHKHDPIWGGSRVSTPLRDLVGVRPIAQAA